MLAFFNDGIGSIGELGEVGFVEGIIHGDYFVDAQTILEHVGKAATSEPLIIRQCPACPRQKYCDQKLERQCGPRAGMGDRWAVGHSPTF